jgi:hypothetical protein
MNEEMPEDRSAWDRAWSSMTHREMHTWHAATIDAIIEDDQKLPIVRITISEDPNEFVDKCHRPVLLCPLCGLDTSASERVAASIHPTLYVGPQFGEYATIMYAVWAHARCLNECPAISEATPIPW